MTYLEVSFQTQTILDTILLPFVYLVVLLLVVPFHAIRYVLNPPRMPGWTFSHYMTINILRSKQQLYMYRRLPARDPEETIIPPFAAKYRRACDVVKVVCPGLREDVPRVDVLSKRRDLVTTRPVPCFMVHRLEAEPQVDPIRPYHSPAQADFHDEDLTRKAEPEERIIYFIVGGGYVAGHPLRVHTPWSLAQITGTRVLCVNYRKSLTAESAFPAALIDCLAGYFTPKVR